MPDKIKCVHVDSYGPGSDSRDFASATTRKAQSVIYQVCSCGCVDADYLFTVATNPDNLPSGSITLPDLGDNYSSHCRSGSDVTGVPSGMVAMTRRVIGERAATDCLGATCCYRVQVDFGTPQSGGGGGSPPSIDYGDTPTEPETWCPTMSVTGREVQVASEFGTFLGAYPEDGHGGCDCVDPFDPILSDVTTNCVSMARGSCQRLQTTAGEQIVGATHEECVKDYVLEDYKAAPSNLFDCVEGTTNCESVELDLLSCLNYTKTFDPYTILLKCISWVPGEVNLQDPVTGLYELVSFWRRTIRFSFDPRGHFHDLLNAGTLQCEAPVCDANGECSSPIKIDGREVSDAQLLDLQGRPLSCESDPIYLRYAKGRSCFSSTGAAAYQALFDSIGSP